MKRNKPIVQEHHIVYENEEHNQKEVKVKIYKGEHFLLTHLNRRKNISKGFIKCLKIWIALNEENSLNLE